MHANSFPLMRCPIFALTAMHVNEARWSSIHYTPRFITRYYAWKHISTKVNHSIESVINSHSTINQNVDTECLLQPTIFVREKVFTRIEFVIKFVMNYIIAFNKKQKEKRDIRFLDRLRRPFCIYSYSGTLPTFIRIRQVV